MSLPEYTSTEWLEKVHALHRSGAENVAVFYEHRMGALCRNPKLLLAPLDDHLVHRGDGVFEAMALLHGRVLQLDAHMQRLQESATALRITPPCSWEKMRTIILDVAQAGGIANGGLRLLLGRGEGGMGVDPAECRESSLYIIITRSRPLPESFWETGLTACRSAIPAKQAYLARIKSVNYLPNALMSMEARERGVNISLAYDENGFLAEAATANVGVVTQKGELLFPHFHRALPGTTALLAMDLAKKILPVRFADVTEADVFAAAEMLALGTTLLCAGIVRYEGQSIGTGLPGPVARHLRSALHEALLRDGTPFLQEYTRADNA